MTARTFARVAGAIYVLVGIMGFVPAFLTPPQGPDLAVDAGYGRLLGLFPVNVLHNVVHLAIGLWGLASAGTQTAARAFARALAIVYGVFAVMGLVPGLQTTFGLVPLFGHDVWLHALTALVAAYFGWRRAPDDVPHHRGAHAPTR
jgi:hypothetical protein